MEEYETEKCAVTHTFFMQKNVGNCIFELKMDAMMQKDDIFMQKDDISLFCFQIYVTIKISAFFELVLAGEGEKK